MTALLTPSTQHSPKLTPERMAPLASCLAQLHPLPHRQSRGISLFSRCGLYLLDSRGDFLLSLLFPAHLLNASTRFVAG